jgi:hypothetical protein
MKPRYPVPVRIVDVDLKADVSGKQSPHLFPQARCIAALPAARAGRDQMEFAHEGGQAGSKLDAAALGSYRFRGYP